MTKDIIKDKFLLPILLTLFWGLVYFKKTNDWVFLLSFLIIMLLLLCIVFYLKNDYYIVNYSIENNLLKIQYHKNFSKKQLNTFFADCKSMESVKFNSKSFLDTFHVISFKYVDKDGLYNKKTLKTNNDKVFIDLLHYLKK